MKYIIRLLKMTKPWAKYMVLAVLGMLGATAINLYTPLITKHVIHYIELGLSEEIILTIVKGCGLLLLLYLLRACMKFLNQY